MQTLRHNWSQKSLVSFWKNNLENRKVANIISLSLGIYVYCLSHHLQDNAQILTGSQSTRKSSNLTQISQWHRRFKPPETKSVVVMKFLVPSRKLKWMLKYCSYLQYFLINRLQRYPSRVVYMFRQISYLEPELRAFTGQEKLTFLRKFI